MCAPFVLNYCKSWERVFGPSKTSLSPKDLLLTVPGQYFCCMLILKYLHRTHHFNAIDEVCDLDPRSAIQPSRVCYMLLCLCVHGFMQYSQLNCSCPFCFTSLLFLIRVAEWPPLWGRAVHSVYCVSLSLLPWCCFTSTVNI